MDEKYIDLKTDFGFKRIFGTVMNKELLIGFLNALFDGRHTITDVTYRNSEHLGTNEDAHRAIFDVYCHTAEGDRMIVEMQNVYQEFFKDRSVYYSTFPISEQAPRGVWNYELSPVYTVGILNFAFPYDGDGRVKREVKLMDTETHTVFYDKLAYIYVELSNFKKTEDELDTVLDKWLFVLKNMQRLYERPAKLQERVFRLLFKAAEIATYSSEERKEYEQSRRAYQDIKIGMDSAQKVGEEKGLKKGLEQGRKEGLKKGREEGLKQGREQGMAEGREQGMAEGREQGMAEGMKKEKYAMARSMKAMGLPLSDIVKITGLTAGEVEKL